jgi:hypothetical protein
MRQYTIAAGERKRILHLYSDSIPTTIKFRAEPLAGNQPVTGQIEVSGSKWLFAKPSTFQPLEANNGVPKGMWDTNFSLYVTPDQDCQITFDSRHLGAKLLFIIIGIVLLLGIAGPLFFALLRALG